MGRHAKKAADGDDKTAPITPTERTKAIGAERARELFHARTKVDPLVDGIIHKVAAVAVAAALFQQVKLLDEWVKPVRKRVSRPPPTLPGWVKPTLRAAANPNDRDADDDNEPTAIVTFGEAAAVAPGKQVDLVPLATRAATFRDEVLKLAGVGKALAEDLEQALAELTCVQPDGRGRQGAFLEALGPGKPRDESRWRFLNRLHREWDLAGRSELEPTETGLLAVYLGVDDGRGGVNGVVKRWSEMIQKAKADAARRQGRPVVQRRARKRS